MESKLADQKLDNGPTVLGGDFLTPPSVSLVLGLNWKVILGENLKAMALQKASFEKATHYCHAENSGSVGYTTFEPESKIVYLSAASLVASQKAVGDFLIALDVNDEQTWLCGVSNGSVVSGYDVVTNEEQLEDTTRRFKERFPNSLICGDHKESGEEYNWNALTSVIANSRFRKDAVIQKTAKGFSERISVVPKKYLVVGGVLFALLIGQEYAWPIINDSFFKQKKATAIDPDEAWREALQEWITSHPVSADGSLNALLQYVADQPIVVAGWRQSAVLCVWGVKAWQCTSKYSAIKRMETNEAFIKAKPKEWTVTFNLLKDIVVKYQVPTEGKRIVLNELKPIREYELATASRMQEIAPLLPASTSPLSAFAQITVTAPQTTEGQPIPQPIDFKLPVMNTVTISGPIRNVAGYQEWVNQVAWTTVDIKIDHKKSPSARDSTVMMDLKGNIYAKN